MGEPLYDKCGRKVGELYDSNSGGCLVGAGLIILWIMWVISSIFNTVDEKIQSSRYKSNSNRIVSGVNQSSLNGRKRGNVIENAYGVYLGNKGTSVTLDVVVREAGSYNIKILTAYHTQYHVGQAVDVGVNDEQPIRVPLTWAGELGYKADSLGNGTISLQSGKNTITLSNEHSPYERLTYLDDCNKDHKECTFIGNVVIN